MCKCVCVRAHTRAHRPAFTVFHTHVPRPILLGSIWEAQGRALHYCPPPPPLPSHSLLSPHLPPCPSLPPPILGAAPCSNHAERRAADYRCHTRARAAKNHALTPSTPCFTQSAFHWNREMCRSPQPFSSSPPALCQISTFTLNSSVGIGRQAGRKEINMFLDDSTVF